MELLVTENGPSNPKHGKAGRLGVWCPEVSFFHAFHDFQGVQNRFWNQVPRPVFNVQELPFFHAFHVVRSSLLNPAPRSRFLVSRSSIFPRFPCCSEFTFEPCSSRLLFGSSQHPLETLESVEMVEATCPAKRPAFEGRWIFLWACRGCNNAKRYDATLGPEHGSQRKARRFCLSPERPADPRRAVPPQHHRPVPLAVRQLRDFNRGP